MEDADQIGKFDKVLELSCRYNGDFKPENIFCAVGEAGELYGVGYLEQDETWAVITKENVPADYQYRLRVGISLNSELNPPEDIKDGLMEALIIAANDIKNEYPDKKFRMIRFIESDDNPQIDYFLSKGFAAYDSCFIMKRDLAEEIADVPAVEGIRVIHWEMASEEEKMQYLDAEAKSNFGECWSLNLLRWYSYGPEWATFTAFYGDKPVGSTMTWMITDERSATENIFVIPEWRRKGVAKLVITEALKFLKSEGKKIATLGVYGNNKPAIALYKSLGYKMYYTNLHFGLDL
jgi:ribosomal protein S18 acetylase RimI-like enzyme